MKISWVILTYNRADVVRHSVNWNAERPGMAWHEIVWCDNGSTDDVRDFFLKEVQPDVSILNKWNQGIPIGYNRALALCSGTHVVITGCDMLMPEDWLAKMAAVFKRVPETGIVSMYSVPMDALPERIRGPRVEINGMSLREGMPIGRRMLPVPLLHEIGFFHHGFSPYGWCDVEWAERAERILKARGLKSWVLPDEVCQHLEVEGAVGRDYPDVATYNRWKLAQAHDPNKIKLLERLRTENYPKFNPFCSCGDQDATA